MPLRLAALQTLLKQDQQAAGLSQGCSSPHVPAAREREPLTGRSSGFTAAMIGGHARGVRQDFHARRCLTLSACLTARFVAPALGAYCAARFRCLVETSSYAAGAGGLERPDATAVMGHGHQTEMLAIDRCPARPDGYTAQSPPGPDRSSPGCRPRSAVPPRDDPLACAAPKLAHGF
jgi:hypothetical protein